MTLMTNGSKLGISGVSERKAIAIALTVMLRVAFVISHMY